MKLRTGRIVRIVFAVVGSLAFILGIITLTGLIVFRPVVNAADAVRVSVVYLTIAFVSFVAVWRLKPPVTTARGFEVIAKPARPPGQ